MRRLILLTGLALVVGLVFVGSGVPAVGGSDLPFKGSETGSTTANLLTGQIEVVGIGPISHMGFATVVQHAQLVPTGATTFNWFGTWTATAADGDELSGTSVGTVTFTDADHSVVVANYVSTGGTGRFADAVATFLGTAHGTRVSLAGAISTGTFYATIDGELSY